MCIYMCKKIKYKLSNLMHFGDLPEDKDTVFVTG